MLPGPTLQVPSVALIDHSLIDCMTGVVPLNVSGVQSLKPMPLPAKSLQRSPPKMTVLWAVPLTVMNSPVCVTWLKSRSVLPMTTSAPYGPRMLVAEMKYEWVAFHPCRSDEHA